MPRPTTAQRGYDGRHQRERERWRPKVEAGLAICARCNERIEPGRPWDLGHNDNRTDWTGPEHTTCNRKAGGRNGALVTNAIRARGTHTSRDW